MDIALYVYRLMYRYTVQLYTSCTDELYFCLHNSYKQETHTQTLHFIYRLMYPEQCHHHCFYFYLFIIFWRQSSIFLTFWRQSSIFLTFQEKLRCLPFQEKLRSSSIFKQIDVVLHFQKY